MSEYLYPPEDTPIDDKKVVVVWNDSPSYGGAYEVSLPGVIGVLGDEQIPSHYPNAIQEQLGEEWWVTSRGFRIEIVSSPECGVRDDNVVLAKVLEVCVQSVGEK